MVNTIGSGIPDSGEDLRKGAETLGAGNSFDSEVRQPLGVSDSLAQEQQAQVDAKRIAELEAQIKNYDGDVGKILRVGHSTPIAPDSIDKVGPRHEYTREDAQAYLDELNNKYPIKEVLGRYYANFSRGESQHMLQSSFVGDTTMENSLYDMIQQSISAGKWVSFLTPRRGIDYIRNHPEGDAKLASIVKFDALGFFDAYPEAHQFLKDYENLKFTGNPVSLLEKIWKGIQMNFEMGKIIKGMDEWSKGVFLKKVGKIRAGKTNDVFEFQTGIFPKEHFIQWLMQRLGTSIQEK